MAVRWVYITAGDVGEAHRIGRALVESPLDLVAGPEWRVVDLGRSQAPG